MGSVIVRLATHVRGGRIHHTDRPSTFARADALAGRRVDRRRRYAIIQGALCILVSWSAPCSGCYESGHDTPNESDRGMGCSECGHTGRSRRSYWVPWVDERTAA